MALLLIADHEHEAEKEPQGMTKPLFTDPERRERTRQMILQKRGMHGGR